MSSGDYAQLLKTLCLDFVFVSKAISDRVSVRAINEPDEWGPSDHCRVEIEVQ
jgi:hypothetical protein